MQQVKPQEFQDLTQALSAGKARKLSRTCCKELSLTTCRLRSSTENNLRINPLLAGHNQERKFFELAWKRSEHLIVSVAPNKQNHKLY